MNVRVIPTSIHGTIDHGVAPTLLAAPAIFRLRDDSPEALVARVVGGMQAVYANLTDYEMSLKNVVPMPVHLALDGLGGAALALVPQFTGARKRGLLHWLPHAAFGAMEVALALLTKTEAPPTKVDRAKNVFGIARIGRKLKQAA
ncbi:MAG: hypothetical protein ACRDLK_03715 [Gaiellaceae bacterium]